MRTLKKIGYTFMILASILCFWLAASFVDIATKNHVSDSNYKGYHDWNLIIILNDYAIENRG